MDPNKDARFSERLNRSIFFLVAILLHLVIFLMIVGYVVFPSYHETPVGQFPLSFLPPAPVPVPPAPHMDQPKAPMPGGMVAPIYGPQGAPIAPPSGLDVGDIMNPESGKAGLHDPGIRLPERNPLKAAPRVDLQEVKIMHLKWDPTGSGHMRFPIYLAKYANGDWDCNHYFHDGNLTSGCLPNLLAKVDEWSHGDLKGREIKVVALDSPELIANPPPFVFFTGHKNFVLTEAEIANLRKYLQNGGAIWGDSAFSGDGSRFDVAFHREMKRVLPDPDLNFEPLPADHDIFIHARFQMDQMPKGMNYHADPIECINLGGKLAVIYTPNDYSDMMTMLLLPGLEERSAQMAPENRWTPKHPLFTPGNFSYHRAAYFRN